jgi:diguanylate cyclase (GGDEF)-like protein
LPRQDGLGVLKGVKAVRIDIDVIILTGHSDEATAIEFLHFGVYDYLLKPVEDIDVIMTAVNRAIHKRNMERENKILLRQLEEMAVRDPLTGLFNYRQLHVSLEQEIQRSKRYGNALSVFIVDVDHFKTINDKFGHLFGDYVLKKLGEIMQHTLRSSDTLFRYGGEELFIILHETSEEESVFVADRILDAIRCHIFTSDENSTKVTVSIGGASFPFQSIDKTALIKVVDQALYKAKELGRDRFVLSDISIL